MNNANFPTSTDDRVYHLDIKHGDVCNNIITVGDPKRALLLSKLLSQPLDFTHSSKRGFSIFTGTFKSIKISIISIGMGFPMMDMMLREVAHVTTGPLNIIRFGSCGGIGNQSKLGHVGVSDAAIMISRNYDYFKDSSTERNPYLISEKWNSDAELTSKLYHSLSKAMGSEKVFKCVNATADSFYSSQGRQDGNFIDENKDLLMQLKTLHPDLQTLEMETFILLHLALTSKREIRASACQMVFADRMNGGFIDLLCVNELEAAVGECVMNALLNL